MNIRSLGKHAACLLLGLIFLPGCCMGYKFGFLIPADVHSVHIKVATNNTFWRDAVKVDNLDIVRPDPTLEEILRAGGVSPATADGAVEPEPEPEPGVVVVESPYESVTIVTDDTGFVVVAVDAVTGEETRRSAATDEEAKRIVAELMGPAALALFDFTPPTIVRPAYPMTVELTQRVKNEVVRRTPLRLARAKEADSILTMSIVAFEVDVRIRNVRDSVLTGEVDPTISFVWTDRRTGRVIAEGRGIRRPTDFSTTQGQTFTIATRTSFDHIAERIVERMQEGF